MYIEPKSLITFLSISHHILYSGGSTFFIGIFCYLQHNCILDVRVSGSRRELWHLRSPDGYFLRCSWFAFPLHRLFRTVSGCGSNISPYLAGAPAPFWRYVVTLSPLAFSYA